MRGARGYTMHVMGEYVEEGTSVGPLITRNDWKRTILYPDGT